MKVDFVYDVGESDEDAYLTGKNIFGVFDGANSTHKFFKDGKSGGRIASETVKEEIAKNDGELTEILLRATRKIKAKMLNEKIDISDKLNLWCTTAAVVRLKEKTFEWAQVTDSLILVIYRDGTHRVLIENYDIDGPVLRIWKKYSDRKATDIKKTIQNEFDNVRRKANVEWGDINGEEAVARFIRRGEESLKDVAHVLLFTDGLFLPKADPEVEDDWDTFVRLFLEGGLKKIVKHVRTLERDDPNCWKYPRFKCHDDITAIALSF